jgi:hypothetical protein
LSTSLNKGNILRIITSNDHIINIEKEKSASTRRSVNEQRWVMSAGRETSSSHHRSKALKPGTRGLFQAIKRTPKMKKSSHREQNTQEEAACKPPHSILH